MSVSLDQPQHQPALPPRLERNSVQSEISISIDNQLKEMENSKESSRSIYDIQNELLQKCTEGSFDFDNGDLLCMRRSNWIALTDCQGRSLPHIILSHAPLTNEGYILFFKLIKLCPDLLTLPDSSGDTPFDILFNNQEIDAIKECLRVAGCKDSMSSLCYLCHAKLAGELIENILENGIWIQEVLSLSPDENPVLLSRKLGKEHLIEIIQKKFFNIFVNNNKVSLALRWKDAKAIEQYINAGEVLVEELPLKQLLEIGCDRKLIDMAIDKHAKKLPGKCSLESKRYIVKFLEIPKLIEVQEYPKDHELLYVTRECLSNSSKVYNDHILTKLLEVLIEKDLFDLSYINDKYYLPYAIPVIFEKNATLGKKIIRKCPKDSLFADMLFWNLPKLEMIVALCQEENIPLQLLPSYKSLVLHQVAEMPPRDSIAIFEQIEQIIPQDQIKKLLNMRNEDNRLPIELLLEKQNIEEKKTLLKKFVKIGGQPPISEMGFLLNLLLSGDDDLDKLISLDQINPESLELTPFEGKECKSIERLRKYFQFIASLPSHIRKSIMGDKWPFDESFVLKHILENSDEEMLQYYVAVVGNFSLYSISECMKSKIDIEFFKKVLEHVDGDYYSIPIENLKNQPLEIIEMILDQFFEGQLELKKPEEWKSVITSFLGRYDNRLVTKKWYDREIELLKLADTEALKEGALHEYRDILHEESLPREKFQEPFFDLAGKLTLEGDPIESRDILHQTHTPISIFNNPDKKKFQVFFFDLETGVPTFKDFPYSPTAVVEVKDFAGSEMKKYEERIRGVTEAFPDEKMEILETGDHFSLSGTPYAGVPSVAKVHSILEKRKFDREAEKEGFVTKDIEKGTFSETIENNKDPKVLFHINSLKLFLFNNFMSYFPNQSNLGSFIAEIERILEAVAGCQITKRSIPFSKSSSLIHEEKANIDLDLLNRLLASYKNSDYLNAFINRKDTNYEFLSQSLKELVSLCKQGKRIKNLNEKDSRTLIIQLSHVLKKLKEGNETGLRAFICQLALDASCEWGAARTVAAEYKSVFNIFQQEDSLTKKNLDSCVIALYGGAIKEALETMTQFVLNEDSQNQALHVISYLRSILEKHISLPPDPLHGQMRDEYIAGYEDFPKDKVFEYFKAFFIPILIKRFLEEQKVNPEVHQVLLDGFADLVPVSKDYYDDLEWKKEIELDSCCENLDEAEQELKSLLVSPEYSEEIEYKRSKKEITNKIDSLCQESFSLKRTLGDLEEDALHPYKKRKIELLGNKSDLIAIEKARIEDRLQKIDGEIKSFKAEYEKLERPAGRRLPSRIKELKNKIKLIEKEKLAIKNRCEFQKKLRIQEYCENEGWFRSDDIGNCYLTEKGIVTLLLEKNYLDYFDL